MQRLFVLLAFVVGCAMPSAVGDIRDREWILVSAQGFDSVTDREPPTVRFGSDGRLSGNSGCNRATAVYSAESAQLNIGPLAMTKRACVESARNMLEQAYVRALEGARRYRIADGQLELLDDAGNVTARFR